MAELKRGDLGAVDELLAPDCLDHVAEVLGLPAGREGAKRLYALLHAGFPDLEVSVENCVAEGSWAVRSSPAAEWQAVGRICRQLSGMLLESARQVAQASPALLAAFTDRAPWPTTTSAAPTPTTAWPCAPSPG